MNIYSVTHELCNLEMLRRCKKKKKPIKVESGDAFIVECSCEGVDSKQWFPLDANFA